MFREVGLQNVRIDKGATCSASAPALQPRPHLVFSRPSRHRLSRRHRCHGEARRHDAARPGIGDDCRGLAVLLAVARAMNRPTCRRRARSRSSARRRRRAGRSARREAAVQRTLKGQIDRFVSIDGTGLGITHIAVGSHRYRVTFKGPGGHSYGAFGMVEPDSRAGPRDREDSRIPGARAIRRPRSTSAASAAARR